MGETIYIRQMQILHEKVEDASDFPFCLPVVRLTASLSFSSPVTLLVGENGTGKSTLLEAIAAAYGFNPEGGSRNFRFATHDAHSVLSECVRLVRGAKAPKDGFFLRAESFYNVATEIDALGISGYYGGASLHEQSHGESFLNTAMHRFKGRGVYLLDEPEAALSPTGQFALLRRIHALAETMDSQFIIATHSPILMAYPGAVIYELTERGAERTPYERTGHYALYRSFLLNPKAVENILSDE